MSCDNHFMDGRECSFPPPNTSVHLGRCWYFSGVNFACYVANEQPLEGWAVMTTIGH